MPREALQQLAVDIRSRGQIHPILLYRGQVLDGRNRLHACRLAKVEPRFEHIDSILDKAGTTPLEHVVSLNLHRRHLKPGQQALAAAAALPQWTIAARSISNANLRQGKRSPTGEKKQSRGPSDELVGKLFGISSRYVRLAVELSRTRPELAEMVRRGDCTLHRAVRAMRADRHRAEDLDRRTRAGEHGVSIEVFHGDARDLSQHTQKSYQLILTDPPYEEDGLPLWSALAQLAGERLTPGGFLVAMSGLHFLDRVFAILSNPRNGLVYYWSICLELDGAHGHRPGLNLMTSWRPALVFCKPPIRRPPRRVLDRLTMTAPPLPEHSMEQKPASFAPLVENFSRPGDWVLDPFAGSGAVLEACRGLQRNATGCELNSKWIRLIERRLGIQRLAS